jgi:hypothetical protein
MKLKISTIPDDKPVKITTELSASVYRDLQSYAAALVDQSGKPTPDLGRLAAAMLARFMMTDRAFARSKQIAGRREK